MKLRAALRIAFLVALTPVLAACGSGQHKASSAGARVFADAGCGGCHTLAAAKSSGTVGPNLDLLKPGYQTVVRQVQHGGNGMPRFAGRLSKSQIDEVASFVSRSARPSRAAVPAFKPDKTTIAQCHDAPCFQQAFGNLAYDKGPEKALAELDADSRSNSVVQADCHPIAHAIGHAGLARYHGDVSQALGHGGMTCASGYYHGVIEEAFAGVPRNRVAAIARRMCSSASIRREEFIAYQCVHGLGHGLMVYSRDDLPYSLHVCEKLPTSWDQTSCDGGVFMQNVVTTMGLRSHWLKANDLIYPCNAVARRHKLYCYLLATSRILPAVGYDWRKTATWCQRSERGWVATCFQSYGRDASGSTQQDPRRTLALCRLAGNMQDECIYGAARDFANTFANGRRATVLCNDAAPRYRSICFYGIGTILATLNSALPARRAACRELTRAYLRDCVRGAGAA